MREKLTKSEAGKLGWIAGNAAAKIASDILRKKRIEEYFADPKFCKNCGKIIRYESHKANSFCSRSCAAQLNGKLFPKRVKVQIEKKINTRDRKTEEKKGYPITRKKLCISPSCNNWFINQNRNCCSIKCELTCDSPNLTFYTTKNFKEYLLITYGNKCMDVECAWSGITINVEMHHIDGNSTNNSLDNISLLCPNCHSLTENYGSKNKGNGRKDRMARYYSGKSY